MRSSTSTGNYLIEKKQLEESISYYIKTICEVDRQQEVRRAALADLQDLLHKLERDFYGA